MVVAAVGRHHGGAVSGRAALAANGRHGLEERDQPGDIVAVAPSQGGGERDAGGVGDQVVFAARLPRSTGLRPVNQLEDQSGSPHSPPCPAARSPVPPPAATPDRSRRGGPAHGLAGPQDESVPGERAGLTSGVLSAAGRFGGAIGVALLGTLIADSAHFTTGMRISLALGAAVLVGDGTTTVDAGVRQPVPCQASRPSLTAIAAMSRAVMGSARNRPWAASPARCQCGCGRAPGRLAHRTGRPGYPLILGQQPGTACLPGPIRICL